MRLITDMYICHVSALCIYPVQVVGEALRECVSHDVCVWVVARALDALYDVFGADECPTQLFSTLQIIPVLKHIASQFTARVGDHDYNHYTLYSCRISFRIFNKWSRWVLWIQM